MNFPEIVSRAQADAVASQPHFVSQEDERRHRQGQRRLAIAEADERAMAQWRRDHPEDVEYECEFWVWAKQFYLHCISNSQYVCSHAVTELS
jgi:hypothetical protein